VYRYRGLVRSAQGKYPEALADYNIVLASRPNDTPTIHSRGLTRFLSGDEQGALEDYTRAAQLGQYPESYNNLGELYYKWRDYQKAKQNFDQAVQLRPTLANAYQGRGAAREELGECEEAIIDYQHAADLYLAQGNIQDYETMVTVLARIQH